MTTVLNLRLYSAFGVALCSPSRVEHLAYIITSYTIIYYYVYPLNSLSGTHVANSVDTCWDIPRIDASGEASLAGSKFGTNFASASTRRIRPLLTVSRVIS